MAIRPIFIAKKSKIGVELVNIEFKFYTGFAKTQKAKSIEALHESARLRGYENILEVSTKSEEEFGRKLSAFNLSAITQKGIFYTVESAFQSSKVFENGERYVDIFKKSSLDAKRDERIRNSGRVIEFNFFKYQIPINPRTFFYDWLYINILLNNQYFLDNQDKLNEFDIFTDIEFNPEKSFNSQAHALALFKSLTLNNISLIDLKNPDYFRDVVYKGEAEGQLYFKFE